MRSSWLTRMLLALVLVCGLTAAPLVASAATRGAKPTATAVSDAADGAAVISSPELAVQVSTGFPQVLGYKWLASGAQLGGQPDPLTTVTVNGTNYTPQVTAQAYPDRVDYTLVISSINVTIQARLQVTKDVLEFSVPSIGGSGGTKVTTLGIPDQSLVSVSADQPDAQLSTAQVYPTYYAPGPDLDNFAPLTSSTPTQSSPSTTSIGIVNTSQLAAAIESNSLQTYGNLEYQTYADSSGTKYSGVWSNTWTYRGPNGVITAAPEAKVVVTGDRNGDGVVNWQDGAIAYREIAPMPVGAAETKNNVVSQIAMNLTSGDQNPFIKTLDDIKKMDLLTDGLGQAIELKGYQDQGHDSGHPDYAGDWNQAAGGIQDIKYLVQHAKQYNTIVGVHINDAMESLDAHNFRWDKTSTTSSDYSFGDVSYFMNTDQDLASGDFASRIAQLIKDVPDLGFIYTDAFFSTDWDAYEEAKVVNGYGLPLYTEFPAYIWPYVAWYHDSNEYNDVGVNSEILRFIYNSDMDAWINDSVPMLGGEQNNASFMGWHSNNSINEEVAQVFTNNLPTKYLQNFQIMKWGTNEIDFTDGVKATMDGSTPQIYADGVLVRDGNDIFLPWSPTQEQKIYAWSSDGGSRTWTLPDAWDGEHTVTLYKLTGNGKEKVSELQVNAAHQVTLDLAKNTPYVIYPTTPVHANLAATAGPLSDGSNTGSPVLTDDTANSVDFGAGTIVKNGEFFAGLSDWHATGDTSGVKVVTDSNGFQNLQITSPNASGASQTLTGLQPGHTYAASAYVSTTGTRTATISVTGYGGPAETNTIDAPPPVMDDQDNRLAGQNFQRFQVLFTEPPGHTTAILSLTGTAGGNSNSGKVTLFTDVRTQLDDGANNHVGGHFYTENFEHTDGGYGPFIPTQMAEQQTIIARSNPGYTRDVISGNYSLLTDFTAGSGLVGLILRTWPGTIDFTPGHVYRVQLDYQDDTAGRYDFQVDADSKSSPLVDIPMAQTTDRGLSSPPPAGPATGPLAKGWTDSLPPQYAAPHASIDTTFTAVPGTYLGLVQNNDNGGSATLDNLVIDDLGPAPAADSGKPLASLSISPGQFASGTTSPVTVTYTNNSAETEKNVTLSLASAQGWKTAQKTAVSDVSVPAGGTATATYDVTFPASALQGDNVLTAKAAYTWNGHQTGVETDINATIEYPNAASAFNNVGVTDDSATSGGQFDSSGDSYSAQALAAAGITPGSTISHDGVSFTWPNVASGKPDNIAASGQTIALNGVPSGEIAVLGASTSPQLDQVTVTYTDGTTSQADVGLADWDASSPNQYGNQDVVSTTGYNTSSGNTATGSRDVFYDTIPTNEGETVQSITLPDDPSLHIFGLEIKPLVAAPPTSDVYASDLQWVSATNGWGPVERDHSNGENVWGDGNAITMNGIVYAKGLGTAPFSGAPGIVTYDTGGNCTSFTAVIGDDDEELGTGEAEYFDVVADGTTLYTSPVFRSGSTAQPITVNITGAQTVQLETNGVNGNGNDHGDWADAMFHCS
jgi:endo-alpha-N-acetylgalactosaminidase